MCTTYMQENTNFQDFGYFDTYLHSFCTCTVHVTLSPYELLMSIKYMKLQRCVSEKKMHTFLSLSFYMYIQATSKTVGYYMICLRHILKERFYKTLASDDLLVWSHGFNQARQIPKVHMHMKCYNQQSGKAVQYLVSQCESSVKTLHNYNMREPLTMFAGRHSHGGQLNDSDIINRKLLIAQTMSCTDRKTVYTCN